MPHASLDIAIVTDAWVRKMPIECRWIWCACLALAAPSGSFKCKDGRELADKVGAPVETMKKFIEYNRTSAKPKVEHKDGRLRIVNWKKYNKSERTEESGTLFVKAIKQAALSQTEGSGTVSEDVKDIMHYRDRRIRYEDVPDAVRDFLKKYNELVDRHPRMTKITFGKKSGISILLLTWISIAMSDKRWNAEAVLEALDEMPFYNGDDENSTWTGMGTVTWLMKFDPRRMQNPHWVALITAHERNKQIIDNNEPASAPVNFDAAGKQITH